MAKQNKTNNLNGSIKIEGDFEIMDCDGKVYGLEGRTALGLCRCGLSSNKPFVMVRTVAI
jgi:CDGSH-type Zn-finger protein